ncbi:hypothetical protein CALVIDRAFT_477845 [Calocera viscosa TUFC12733]|uniref:Uncharacterized protein n=1 Tax=Calocera viscosa (strain TUFC12733) TaxID=1330018 RepID=A0A167PQ31_CALVF|nr:hypothetical protein CALVIDRAFT_477845 [Calocera viscosa TUFC12733]
MKDITDALPNVSFSREAKRRRAKLLEEVLALPAEHLDILRRTLQAISNNRKRKSINQEDSRKRARSVKANSDGQVDPPDRSPADFDKFLQPPRSSVIEDCERSLIRATSNDTLKNRPCCSCSGEFFQREMEMVPFTDIPNSHRLVPSSLLIAHHYPKVFHFTLFPKQKRNLSRLDPSSFSKGMRGNVTLYSISQDDIASMLEGKFFPRPLRILPSVIAISFIGLMKVEDVKKYWLRKTFSVRRHVVYRALRWLKVHNRYYADINLDDEAVQLRIAELPEDAVPEEILGIVREEDRTIGVDRENDPYDPERVGDNIDNGEDDTVVPLRSMGVHDTDLTRATSNEILMHALSNLDKPNAEGAYAVRHSGTPVNDFGRPRRGDARDPTMRNPLAAAFVTLFPYGEGGPEEERPIDISLQEHGRWTLRYYDRCFRLSDTWIFVVFGIIQKRDALTSASIQMRRKDFKQAQRILSRLTIEDLQHAAEEEEQTGVCTDHAVRALQKHLRIMSGRVMGSDSGRIALQNCIWGTSAYLAPPNIWFTISPNDLHDPIAQVFVGEDIDMDRFMEDIGPSKTRRANSIARDPYAAAKFFQYIVSAMLRCLFRIHRSGGSGLNVTSQATEGILGEVSAYFGPVEAQGKGTLHCHFLIWLANAPNPVQMRELLQDGMFREHVSRYLAETIRADLPELRPETIDQIPKKTDCAYSRPVDPDAQDYSTAMRELETTVARNAQLHHCSIDTCLKAGPNGSLKCKRRAPFRLSETNFIMETGTWGVRRLNPYLNAWNPVLARTMHCNHDMKLQTNGAETKDAMWYCACYALKKQGKSYNIMGTLAKHLAYHFQDTAYMGDILNRNRLMIYRCFNVLNREQEKAASQCVSYIMGWGDVWQSHNYVTVHLNNVAWELLNIYPYLRRNSLYVIFTIDARLTYICLV